MPTKIVVFDLWNTLVYDPSKENHEKIARLLGFENRQDLWDYCDKHFFHRKLTFYDFIKELIKQRNLPEETFDKIKELWEDSKKHVSLFPDAIKTLERLKKKYKLVLLSNTSKEEGEETVSRFGLKKYFDQIIFSCGVGMSKPNPEIFELVLDKMNVKPKEVVVVGDNLEMDIIPARVLGMRGILVDTRKKYGEYKNEEWYIGNLSELTIKQTKNTY